MRVNVGELLADPHAIRVLPFSERLEPPAEDVTLPGPVQGQFTLAGTGRSVLLRGQVRAVVGLVCGTCLAPYEESLEVTVGDEFCRAAAGPGGVGREELAPEDFRAPLEPGDVLDVTEVVRQHLALALPIAPRCSPDCRGLCPRCGADRNRTACTCEDEEADPRLEPLRRWASGGPLRGGSPSGGVS